MKLSLSLSFLGVFFLLFLSNIIKPKIVSNLKELELNERVITKGKIIEIKNYDSFSIIKLDNNITITCNCQLEKNQIITVEGKVEEYKNKLQIQAEKIQIENVI